MSLSRFLQSKLFSSLQGKTPFELKTAVLQEGYSWFNEHPEETTLIVENIEILGKKADPDLIKRVQENILLHYYEKLLPVMRSPMFYHDFLVEHIDAGDTVEKLKTASDNGKGILLTVAHFGAVEFIAPYLASNFFPISVLLKFTTQQLSKAAHEQVYAFTESKLFGPIHFIELGKPGTSAALDMAAVLRRKEFLLTVFDEKTDYSIPVTLFGKKIWGGAGLDKLIAFTGSNIALFSAFMIREDNGRYRLELTEIDLKGTQPVQILFDKLEKILENYFEQWYFLHEKIPFVPAQE
jgi:hypothetical protein